MRAHTLLYGYGGPCQLDCNSTPTHTWRREHEHDISTRSRVWSGFVWQASEHWVTFGLTIKCKEKRQHITHQRLDDGNRLQWWPNFNKTNTTLNRLESGQHNWITWSNTHLRYIQISMCLHPKMHTHFSDRLLSLGVESASISVCGRDKATWKTRAYILAGLMPMYMITDYGDD